MFKGNKNVIKVSEAPDCVPQDYVPVYTGGQNFLVHKDSKPHLDNSGNVVLDGKKFTG
jgi:hypothetical protein